MIPTGTRKIASHNLTNEDIARKVCRAYPGLFEYLGSLPNELMWHEGYAVFDKNENQLRVKCYEKVGSGMAGAAKTEIFELRLSPEQMQEHGIGMPS